MLYSQYDVLPWGLEGVLAYIKENYGNPPVYILENGLYLSLSLFVLDLVSKTLQNLGSFLLTKYYNQVNPPTTIHHLTTWKELNTFRLISVLYLIQWGVTMIREKKFGPITLITNTKRWWIMYAGMAQRREATSSGRLWICTSFLIPITHMDYTMWISAIRNVKGLRRPLPFGTLLFSKGWSLVHKTWRTSQYLLLLAFLLSKLKIEGRFGFLYSTMDVKHVRQ